MDPDLIEKIDYYFESRPEVVAAYLFGSHASGHAGPSSDVDVGVLIDHGAIPIDEDIRMTYTVGLGQRLRMDFHVVVMNHAGEGILAQIFKHGKCVFERDHEMVARFKTSMYSRIADFGYLRELMEKAFVTRILGGG